MKTKTLCIIQARTGSTRFPRKVLKKVAGKTLLEHCISRVTQVASIDKIVVATTTHKRDDVLALLCKRIKISCVRGSETDLLDRYYRCSLAYPEYNTIVRITSDCPIVDPKVAESVIAIFYEKKLDYACNIDPETFPDGMDVEVFTKKALIEAAQKATLPSEREHMTQYIRKQKKFKKGNVSASHNWAHFRMTVDEPEDFDVIKFLLTHTTHDASYMDYIVLLSKNPDIMLKNMYITRNSGLLKSLQEDEKQKSKSKSQKK
ncbi:MAG: spore coat protein [Candidatus Lloydbacteria bacterium CG22_combo_CG10-13_8_21_14_all_47_15]|uniref:Spore coat protein n=1 Tax=Candidatus Lloydbacteria bacterium CG22_combo_CG10-13_8_21_14_all_47_15 TaxID=1974635 RepID=A0A2H0CUD0_9BACT|nr:MAG: spore coat protein [Candidatus Lloydbacteria bacterium CG22_combo_CG10-13_8_21_14_all_47_15]